MGKVPPPSPPDMTTNLINKKKKKKGRPPKNSHSTPPTNRRSVRRNPNSPEFDGDDDDERKQKKVNLVGRLPESDDRKTRANQKQHSVDYNSGSDYSPVYEEDAKRRKISDGSDGIQEEEEEEEEEAVKATDTSQHESPLGSGPTAPLPDKKLLVFILDRLQKKDTYGVFSEPVDPDELPDYFEIIKQPMDFSTLRNKLDTGAYHNLNELEADVLLICSNAMQYNSPNTVYHRQARTIQDLAKRDFDNLRHEGDDGEPQPKVVRRGRPPGQKSQKKPVEVTPVSNRVTPEVYSGVSLATGEDRGAGSYNLRKAPAFNRFRYTDPPYMSSYRWKNGENYTDSAEWNNEFPASIIRADMKQGKKNFIVDESRRDTYREFHPLSFSNNSSTSSYGIGDVKQLVPVGAQEPLAYARSLARFAATLGPVAWKVASQKIEATIPLGTKYGLGWVGDNGTQSHPLSVPTDVGKSSNSTLTPSTSDPSSAIAQWPSEGMVEAVRKLNSQNEVAVQGDGSSWRVPYPHIRNGLSGGVGYDLSSPVTLQDNQSSLPPVVNPGAGAQGQMWNFGKMTWPVLPMQRNSVLVQPDLNIRVPAGSPSTSGVLIGSPHQPDLALQL